MQAVGFIVFLVVGLIQVAATIAGLTDWLGLHWIFAVPLALILGYLPLVGAIFGMIGAVSVWHWEWWEAAMLFFGAFAFALVVGGFATITDSLLNRRPQ
jgi:hypothetical protein